MDDSASQGPDLTSPCCLDKNPKMRVCTLYKHLNSASLVPNTLLELHIETLAVCVCVKAILVLLLTCEAWKEEEELEYSTWGLWIQKSHSIFSLIKVKCPCFGLSFGGSSLDCRSWVHLGLFKPFSDLRSVIWTLASDLGLKRGLMA